MKKTILFIFCAILLIGIYYFQKFTYERQSASLPQEVLVQADNLLDNPLERLVLVGYEVQSSNDSEYILNAKTLFGVTFATLSITCTSGNCSGKVLDRF